jgi:single-strand DNA-binding protein
MSKSLNKVMLIGNLGADAEFKTAGTTNILSFRLATSQTRKGANGESEEYPEWHRVVTFGRMAEAFASILKKGNKVYVEGSLQTRSWGEGENKRYTTEVIASNILTFERPPVQQESADSSRRGVYPARNMNADRPF